MHVYLHIKCNIKLYFPLVFQVWYEIEINLLNPDIIKYLHFLVKVQSLILKLSFSSHVKLALKFMMFKFMCANYIS